MYVFRIYWLRKKNIEWHVLEFTWPEEPTTTEEHTTTEKPPEETVPEMEGSSGVRKVDPDNGQTYSSSHTNSNIDFNLNSSPRFQQTQLRRTKTARGGGKPKQAPFVLLQKYMWLQYKARYQIGTWSF